MAAAAKQWQLWYRHISMKALKTFVLWLLLCVIPLQGMAINAVTICKAADQHASQAQTPHADAWQDATSHAQQPGAAQHASHGDMHSQGDPDHYKLADGSCTGSAFCPLASWMSVDRVTLPIIASASTPISYIPFHVPFVVPDGPEHRPRLLFA